MIFYASTIVGLIACILFTLYIFKRNGLRSRINKFKTNHQERPIFSKRIRTDLILSFYSVISLSEKIDKQKKNDNKVAINVLVGLENLKEQAQIFLTDLIESTNEKKKDADFYSSLIEIEDFFRNYLGVKNLELYDYSEQLEDASLIDPACKNILNAFVWLQCLLCEINYELNQLIGIVKTEKIEHDFKKIENNIKKNLIKMFSLSSNENHWINYCEYEESAIHFDPVKLQTHCSFAAKSLIWGHKMIEEDEKYDLEEQFLKLIPHITACAMSQTFPFDKIDPVEGFVACLPENLSETYEDLCTVMQKLFVFLSKHDCCCSKVFSAEVIDKFYQLRFLKELFFVTSFGKCYSPNSSRFGFDVEKTFILLQPLRSFERHHIPPPPKPNDKVKRKNVRNTIRAAFKANGRDYHSIEEMHQIHIVPQHYVLPLSLSHDYVPWWEIQTK